MREVDITSPSEVAAAVADTVQSAALAALAELESIGHRIYGKGITNPDSREDFTQSLAAGERAVRQSAGELAKSLADSGLEWARQHEHCDDFAMSAGESATTLAATLGKLADEVERGWVYGDGLVRTLDILARAVGAWADIVVTGKPAELDEVPIYGASVPAELAGMVAV